MTFRPSDFPTFQPSDQLRSRLFPGYNDEPDTDDETGKHQCQQAVDLFGCAFEFFPDKHAPQRGDEGGALPQPVGDRIARFAGGNDAERHADAPDDATEDAHEMGFKVARKILLIGDRFAFDRLFHEDGVEDKVAQQDTQRKDDNCGIAGHFSGFRRNKVGGHRSGNESIERSHQHPGNDGKNDAFGRCFFRSAQFSVGNGVDEDGRRNKSDARKEQGRVALRRGDIVNDHAHDQRNADPDRECD